MARVVAVTGAAGFIGRHLVKALLERGDYVYAVDALTAPADPTLPAQWARFGDRFHFVASDINALERLPALDAVFNLAAETHVDNSVQDSRRFLHTNVLGVSHLLTLCRQSTQFGIPRFIQVSTDEVYGDREDDGVDPHEFALLWPSSPYAATKAAADQLVIAAGRTFGIPWNIVRPSNCYGLGQHPEKLIPRTIRARALGRRATVHGDGIQTRCWLHVADAVTALLTVLDAAEPCRIFNVGGEEHSVIGVVGMLTDFDPNAVEYVVSPRPGADLAYRVDDAALRKLGWARKHTLAAALPRIAEIEAARFRW